ncbi:M16 family metallopeptidase [Sulfurimonas paralvinellae]|uniref:Insulinase family protein n=1 Tax=Sulfurimonas paralvinellae TaxID=317658 RepID=A0A7M1B6B4_9BACT|nr:pitrilysin family protein [Sulfurimonas paralvinellae]QOP45056.1 insulinase family protein [Sulfurimonas paralvinellae]
MKFLILLFLITGQIVMAAKIEHIEVKGIKIPLIFEEDRRLPLVNTQIVFTNSGSITDTKKAGLAKFSAKMLNEGSREMGANGFAEMLESKAIHMSASTGSETFVIEMGSLNEQFKQSAKYLKMLLKSPNFTERSLKKVKTMTMGAISRKENDYDYVASNALKSLLFKGTVLAQPASGTLKSVQSITLEDVKNFTKKHLVLSRAIVVVGGDVDIEAVKKELAKVLKILPKGKSEPLPYFEANGDAKTEVLKRETEQAYIYFGSPYNMAVNDEDYYKARVATFILGTGGFGSRLMEEIRVKRGLAYSAYARVHVSKSVSYLNGYLQTKIESQDEAKKTVQEVIEQFVKNGVTQDELEQTKKFLLGSEPLRVETMSQRLNRTFMDYYKGFPLDHSKKELQKIKDLQLDDLNDFIKQHREILKLSFAIVTK